MFGKVRQITGLGNRYSDTWSTASESGASTIGFNFEGVGQPVNGKTAVVKLHKIRYSPMLTVTGGQVGNNQNNSFFHVWSFLSPVDTLYNGLTVGVSELMKDIYDNQTSFGIAQDLFCDMGDQSLLESGTQCPVFLQTKEVSLDVLLPFQNINCSSYYFLYTNSGVPATMQIYWWAAAELFYSYELLTPVEYQQLKNDWQGRVGPQVPQRGVIN